MIVFPAIDLRRGRCVRLRQGRSEEETVYDNDPVSVACQWVAQGAAWLHVVNLDGAFGERETRTGVPINLQRLREIRTAVPNTPIQFGGGVRTPVDVEAGLGYGATRVILGTLAVFEPDSVAEAVLRYGAERIVVAIDARDGLAASHGWRRISNTTAVALGQAMSERGITRIVYTDISRDGMLTGVNAEATADMARATGLKVIASGGVASLADLARLRAHKSAGIEGVIIGQALYTGTVSLPEAIRAAASPEPEFT